MMPRAVFVATSAAALALTTTFADAARADDSATALAKEAYDRGAAAYDAHDYRLAAREFAHADELSPNAVALQAALESAVAADDASLGMELVERAKSREGGTAFHAAVDAARVRFGERVGRIVVRCRPSACSATVDGAPVAPESARWVTIGPHRVGVSFAGGARLDRDAQVHAGAVTDVLAEEASTAGLPRGWFYAGLAATGAFAALGVASAIDTSRWHGKFVDAHCAAAATSECAGFADSGSAAQRRTNVLLGVGAALGVGTIVTGLFFTRWRAEVGFTIGERQAAALLRFSL